MILRKAGIPPKRRKVTAEQEVRVRELWTEGLKPEAIAVEVGMGHANVRLIVAEHSLGMTDDGTPEHSPMMT
ncbi:hypothetical protein ACE11G_11780 [Gordonia sp. PS3]|uniref:hypothetical protein n=1 Tax=Gordonia sp. PS3 TaxID=3248841 RepID=UPI0035C0FEA8